MGAYREVLHSLWRSIGLYKCASLWCDGDQNPVNHNLQWKTILSDESRTPGMRTESTRLKSWKTSGGESWSKQEVGGTANAATFWMYRVGKTAVLMLEKRIWQWLETEIIRLDQWVLAMISEYLRLVWKKTMYCSSADFGSPAWLNQAH